MHNNFFLVGIPFIISPAALFVSLAQKEDKNLDKEIYYSFKGAMKENIKSQFGINFDLEGQKGLLLVVDLFTAFGWGALKQVDADAQKKRAIVVVNNSPIAGALAGKARQPVDSFLRGIIAGTFCSYFNEDVECVESQCSAQNQPSCEFIVKRKEEFDFSKEPARSQLDLDK